MGKIKEGKGTLLGNAGEHSVVAELLRRGVIASLAPRNAPAIDVLTTTGQHSAVIRVKTKSEEADSWIWNTKKDGSIFQNILDKGDFTILVDLQGHSNPVGHWVIPTKNLDHHLQEGFEKWRLTPGKMGRPHDPLNKMRRIGQQKEDWPWLERYKDNWDVIMNELNSK